MASGNPFGGGNTIRSPEYKSGRIVSLGGNAYANCWASAPPSECPVDKFPGSLWPNLVRDTAVLGPFLVHA